MVPRLRFGLVSHGFVRQFLEIEPLVTLSLRFDAASSKATFRLQDGPRNGAHVARRIGFRFEGLAWNVGAGGGRRR